VTDKHDREVIRLAVTLLRALPNWDRETLFRQSGVYPSQTSGYESGKVVPRRKNLHRISTAVKVKPHLLAHILSFLAELLTAWKGNQGAPSSSRSGGESHWGAEILGEEAARARAEIALLVKQRLDREST
jgi:hypothetical protein